MYRRPTVSAAVVRFALSLLLLGAVGCGDGSGSDQGSGPDSRQA